MKREINFIKFFFDEKDRFKISILTFFLIATTFFEVLSIGVLIPVAYNILGLSYDASQNSQLIKFIDFLNFSNEMSLNLMILASVFIIKNFFIYYFNKFRVDLFSEVYLKNSRKVYQNYLNKNYEDHISRNISLTNQNIINELRSLTERFFNPAVVIVSELLILVVIIISLIFLKQYMIFMVIFLLGLVGLIYLKIFSNYFYSIGKRRRENEAMSRQIVSEGLMGFKEILILNKQSFYLDRFSDFSKKYIFSNNIFSYLAILPRIILETVVVIIFAALIILTLRFQNQIPIESVILFLAISYRLLPVANRLALNFNYVKFSFPILKHLEKEKIFKETRQNSNNIIKKIQLKENIKIKDVNFNYKNNKKKIIKNLNLEIKKNTITGIFGPSGSGKSTLVNLITGLLTPKSGQILLDGKDINKNLNSYQNLISYLSQDLFLMNDTVLNNITFGEKLSSQDKKKLIWCLKKVKIFDFLKQKKGIYTNISQQGFDLSGGQKQKIIIARSLFNNKEIIVLDEATSSLDKSSEQELIKLIYSLKKIKTIIIISHDINLMRKVDKLIKF